MRDKKIKIEEIQAKDNQIIYDLIQRILKSYGLDQAGTAYSDPYLDQLYEFYQKEADGEYWLIKKEEIIIGGIGIGSFGEDKKIAEVQKFYIKEEYQGYGYGSLLLNKALNFAENQGYQKVYIETMDRLNKANEIYKHYGFESLEKPLPGSEHGLMNRWFILELK